MSNLLKILCFFNLIELNNFYIILLINESFTIIKISHKNRENHNFGLIFYFIFSSCYNFYIVSKFEIPKLGF